MNLSLFSGISSASPAGDVRVESYLAKSSEIACIVVTNEGALDAPFPLSQAAVSLFQSAETNIG
jgi:hypothetical protein